jgi:erythromycin esterase-like protein
MNMPRATALSVALAILFLLSAGIRAQPERGESRQSRPAGESKALNAATRDLCGRDVVMLGENGFHGDGQTVAFKASLIPELIRRCHFNAVFFESSHYDFLEISRRLRVGEMVSSAIGAIWNRDEELAPLVPFLFTQARAGRIALGGLDDQLGSLGAFYSNDGMPTELAGHLDPERREMCEALLHQRIYTGHPGPEPRSEPDYARLRQCLADIRTAIPAGGAKERARRDELLEMVANIERSIARDPSDPAQRNVGRDYSMFLNLRWLASRVSPRPKIIIWAANAHVAKETSVHPAFGGGPNLGSHVQRAYGSRSFALGFTAASGSFRWGAASRPIPVAPPDSLEARALAGHDGEAAYVGPARLARMGRIRGATADDHQYVLAQWAHIYDGIIVLRTERPTTRRE